MKKFFYIVAIALVTGSCSTEAQQKTIIGNLEIELALSVSGNIPYIESLTHVDGVSTRLFDKSEGKELSDWLLETFLGEVNDWSCSGWQTEEDAVFTKAVAGISLNGIRVDYHVDLLKERAYFRQYYTLTNEGQYVVDIPKFPVLFSKYEMNDSTGQIRWWKALSYTPHQEDISPDTDLILRSKVHSSDDYSQTPGNVPYWYMHDNKGTLYHAIAWSGGWQANIRHRKDGLLTRVFLNRMETQLELKPGESVKGPEMYIFATQITDEMMGRKAWLDAREQMAAKLHPGPDMEIPFIYNHWYAIETNVDEAFIRDQVEPVKQSGFDVFVIDDGWFNEVGSWSLHQEKFSKEGFTNVVNSLKDYDVMVGLWSCPQLKTVEGDIIPEYIDQPGIYVGYMDAWLIDIAGTDFTNNLNKHVDTLTNYHGAGWWKFDQNFFGRHSRHGKIRNVNALHDAISSVRKNYPDLVIESCMGGGKMINEFTDMVTQIHWIRDGTRSGYMHAISNIHEAMGATEFLAPAKVQRWNNRLEEVDSGDMELLRFYMRSCMLGTWGISTDLSKLDDNFLYAIQRELDHYRKINKLKKHNLFEHQVPREYTGNVYAVYYNEAFTEAAVILYRMFKENKTVRRTIQTRLKPGTYRIIDADRNTASKLSGSRINIQLDNSQLSAIYFVEQINK
jgi:alpha-galactosidase